MRCEDALWRTVPAQSAEERSLSQSWRTEYGSKDTGGTGSHRGCRAQALERSAAAARDASGADGLSSFRAYQSCGTQMSMFVVPAATLSEA